MKLQNFSQNDPRWKNVKIGDSTETLGESGCFVTSICNLNAYFAVLASDIVIPPVLAVMPGLFTAEGNIIIEKLDMKLFKFDYRVDGFSPARIDDGIKDPRKGVILRVRNNYWDKNLHHFVLALSKIPFTNIYKILDPWDGKIKFSTAYGIIDGSRHFISK